MKYLKTPNPQEAISEWGDPLELMKSHYGLITYKAWCDKEKERLNACGDKVKVIDTKGVNGDLICLSR